MSASRETLTVKNSKVRQQIAWEAARLIHLRPDLRYSDARRVAGGRICPLGVRPRDLPSDGEVSEQLQALAQADVVPNWDDRFGRYVELLAPLAKVRQSPEHHPEGDALYHSLQVFELVRDRLGYDEELLTAALLHAVGLPLDRHDPAAAGLLALQGWITPRTANLIENLKPAQALAAGTLGARARRRLEAEEDYDQLMLLAECDRQGRCRGAAVGDLEDALQYLRDLAQSHEQCENDCPP